MKKQLIICSVLLSFLILTTNSVLATQYNYSTIGYPNAYSTKIAGINDYGQVVGWYNNDSGTHGFMATVVPEPISSILFVTGGVVLAGRRYLRRKRIS